MYTNLKLGLEGIKMNDSVFNVVVSNKCNAKCPYCISPQTPEVCKDYSNFDYSKLMLAVQYAVRAGIQTCKLTGKNGDPLCERKRLGNIVGLVRGQFPIIELQTNGISLSEKTIIKWLSNLGVTLVAVSCVHHDHRNAQLYGNSHYPHLPVLADQIHANDLTMRLSCTLIRGYIDSAAKIDEFLAYFEDAGIEQFSFIPVGWNDNDSEQARWSEEHQVTVNVWDNIRTNGTLLWETSYGGAIYDYKGKNVYIADCLSSPVKGIRSLIYYPDGRLRYSWTKPGAIIF